MWVPGNRRGGTRSLAGYLVPVLLVAATLSGTTLPVEAAGTRGPKPTLRISLADLGFPGLSSSFESVGASMLTLNLIDNTHVLLTFSSRGLVERIPDDPPEDDDRAVEALLVDLSTGKVLARTRWHLHDHAQYLWGLGNGRFLLRNRSILTAFAPLLNLDTPDPFKATSFLHVMGVIDALEASPEGDLLTVEMSPPRKPSTRQQASASTSTSTSASTSADILPRQPRPPETFYFVRVSGTGALNSPILAAAAGAIKVRGVGTIPINGRGYLLAKSQKRSRWSMQFDTFDGESRKLATLDSSCAPRMQLVSPSQYVAFTCRGSDDRVMLSAFDFEPHEMWEEPLSGTSPYAQFAFAQQAGRFAISRTVSGGPSNSAASTNTGIPPDPALVQEVKIYQTESGDLLLKLICTPTFRTGQNFDLASDGLSVVIVRDGAIELYRLPPLSPRDAKELAAVQQHEPSPAKSARIELQKMLKDAAAEAVEADAETAAEVREKAVVTANTPPPAAAAAPPAQATKETNATKADGAPLPTATTAASTPPANASANEGDAESVRKPPSLLNPGEAAENQKKDPKPK